MTTITTASGTRYFINDHDGEMYLTSSRDPFHEYRLLKVHQLKIGVPFMAKVHALNVFNQEGEDELLLRTSPVTGIAE